MPASFNGTTATYAPLTLENIIDDGVALIDFIKKSVNGTESSKTIIGGGKLPTIYDQCSMDAIY